MSYRFNIEVITTHIPGMYSDELRVNGDASIVINVGKYFLYMPWNQECTKSNDMLCVVVDKFADEVRDLLDSKDFDCETSPEQFMNTLFESNKKRRGGDNALYTFVDGVIGDAPYLDGEVVQVYASFEVENGTYIYERSENYKQIL